MFTMFLLQNSNQTIIADSSENSAHGKKIDDSNIIRTYAPMSNDTFRNNSLQFDISETPETDSLLSAELRLYIDSSRIEYTVLVHNWEYSDNGEKLLRLVDSTRVNSHFEGWIKLNVTQLLQRWIDNSTLLRELRLSTVCNSSWSKDCEDYGKKIHFDGNLSRDPFIVAYFSGLNTVQQRSTGNFSK